MYINCQSSCIMTGMSDRLYQLQYPRSPSFLKEALTVGSERAAVMDLAVSDATPFMVMSTTTWGRLSALRAASYTLHTVISDTVSNEEVKQHTIINGLCNGNALLNLENGQSGFNSRLGKNFFRNPQYCNQICGHPAAYLMDTERLFRELSGRNVNLDTYFRIVTKRRMCGAKPTLTISLHAKHSDSFILIITYYPLNHSN